MRIRILYIIFFLSGFSLAAPLKVDVSDYYPQEGLIAELDENVLTITWQGDPENQLKAELVIIDRMPLFQNLWIKKPGGSWKIVGSNLCPEFRVVSGVRRVTQQQTEPLEELGIPLTAEKLDEIKWDAFWDAPLYISDELPRSHKDSIPAEKPVANHPGMPRKQTEITRTTAVYNVSECTVVTNGARIQVRFPGVTAGIFSGYLQLDFFKGSNLIRQSYNAKTDHPSTAFKYDAGLAGISVTDSSSIVWRDIIKNMQTYKMGGPVNENPVTLFTSNRLTAAKSQNGGIAAFPPPHSFYWARESEENLGYGWYRKDVNSTFAFGVRQAENELNPEFYYNFALYNARPNTWQNMSVFFYISAESPDDAIQQSLKFTNGDVFKPLSGYKVMGHHYHVGLVKRLQKLGGFNARLNDVETMKGIGVDIFSIIDGARGPGRKDTGELYLNDLHEYAQAALYQSDKDFLVMPNDENSTGGRRPFLGGHYDILFSKPVYWRPQRLPGQPLADEHPKYGKVYNLGTPGDMMKMTELENALISLPHPNTKRSTGYPEAFKDEPHFLHKNYFSLGYRWGMGIDASEKRLGEYRFQNLWDKTNNWMAQHNRPPKYALAISEARSDYGRRGRPPYDDAYGMSPVNYLKVDSVPHQSDMSIVINALKNGDYFVTSGEVLITNYKVDGTGANRTIEADVEWTFPLDFVEVVWGDGEKTGREIISTSELQPFGKKTFNIPFNTTGKKWVRFAAWDVATNGAMVQPIQLK